MKVKDLLNHGFKVVTDTEGLDNEIKGCYICDLLSWVMGRATEDNVWITIQGHLNIVAVASLTMAGCIVVAEDAPIDPETIKKANSEGIPILTTSKPAYETALVLAKIMNN